MVPSDEIESEAIRAGRALVERAAEIVQVFQLTQTRTLLDL
jgi:hypothetical protein